MKTVFSILTSKIVHCKMDRRSSQPYNYFTLNSNDFPQNLSPKSIFLTQNQFSVLYYFSQMLLRKQEEKARPQGGNKVYCLRALRSLPWCPWNRNLYSRIKTSPDFWRTFERALIFEMCKNVPTSNVWATWIHNFCRVPLAGLVYILIREIPVFLGLSTHPLNSVLIIFSFWKFSLHFLVCFILTMCYNIFTSVKFYYFFLNFTVILEVDKLWTLSFWTNFQSWGIVRVNNLHKLAFSL